MFITLNVSVTSLSSNGGTVRIEVPEAPAPHLEVGSHQYLALRYYQTGHSTRRTARIVPRTPFTVDFPNLQEANTDWLLVSALAGGGTLGMSGMYICR